MTLKIADMADRQEEEIDDFVIPETSDSPVTYTFDELLMKFRRGHLLVLRHGNNVEGPYEVLASDTNFGNIQSKIEGRGPDGADEWLSHVNIDEISSLQQAAPAQSDVA